MSIESDVHGGDNLALCDFGKTVKKRLVDLDKTQKWLMEEIADRTGLYIDGYYLNKILTGQRHPEKIVSAIKEILEIS